MITDQRKKELNKLSGFLTDHYTSQNVTLLEKIAESEGISIYYDHYEDSFDGMLVCDGSKNFHIHINIDRGNSEGTKRGRFTLAHELAHYFIDEHRIPLSEGTVEPHGSLHDYQHRDEAESEADYFAGCLLMPEKSFRQIRTARKFSLDTILTLSDAMNTSVLATIIRFAEVGTHPIFAIFSKDNVAKWFTRSEDFPKWSHRFKVKSVLPSATVAGEFFTKTDAKYTGVEDIEPDNWFIPGWVVNSQMHEQCYFSESYGFVLGILWFD